MENWKVKRAGIFFLLIWSWFGEAEEEDDDFWRASLLGVNFWRLKGLEVKLKENQAIKGKKSSSTCKKLVFKGRGINPNRNLMKLEV